MEAHSRATQILTEYAARFPQITDHVGQIHTGGNVIHAGIEFAAGHPAGVERVLISDDRGAPLDADTDPECDVVIGVYQFDGTFKHLTDVCPLDELSVDVLAHVADRLRFVQ